MHRGGPPARLSPVYALRTSRPGGGCTCVQRTHH